MLQASKAPSEPGASVDDGDADPHSRACGEMSFRRFRVQPGKRQLLRDGRPVEIGSRAFDLLMLLLASRGSVVSKAQIFRTVWLSVVVHEGNLRFQMAMLRKLLGADRDVIKTVPGRGYMFIEDEVADEAEMPAPSASTGSALKSSDKQAHPLIIVIDDDGMARAKVAGQLRSAGFRVESYGTVEAFRRCGSMPHQLKTAVVNDAGEPLSASGGRDRCSPQGGASRDGTFRWLAYGPGRLTVRASFAISMVWSEDTCRSA